jgi:hypothetical protein
MQPGRKKAPVGGRLMRDAPYLRCVSQLAHREACVKQNARRTLREARLASQSNERRASPRAHLAFGSPGAWGEENARRALGEVRLSFA